MKKFLSLVLAMIMAMSLVTISAGAVSYEELTDKDEIPHDREEAVAVLNAIGIIGGYDDGSYRPDAPLTRQVAAKFIVSLLIGPEAAKNLTVTTAPYPDVALGTEWASYISYCKTANIISGYSDGTFKPEGPLTGYAFSKMLLGAIGYRGDIEGFTGSGWTMNVAKIGNAANLFDRLKFQGGETLNRADAAQLCLNTLKATMVEYSGGFSVTAGDATVVGAQTRNYVTSNQEYAKYISNRKLNTTGNNTSSDSHYTVEFGEEHFKDLRMNDEHQGRAYDDFGRPSNKWSWKKVTIGTFPIEPDFVYDTQKAAMDNTKVTDASKIRALELNGYYVDNGTKVNLNGLPTKPFTKTGGDADLAKIANYTDNGTLVEVYVSEDDADYIKDVVVIHTQLMQIKKVASESVSLKKYKDEGASGQLVGFNNKGEKDDFYKAPYTRLDIGVEDVEVNDPCYEFLSGQKADDIVAIVPVTSDGETYTVAAAYKPETVTGALTGSSTFSNSGVEDSKRTVTEVTVGGTTYKVATWNKDLNDINRDKLKVTKKDVTLYLDEFGNAMLATDVGATNDYMILGSWKAAVVNGTIVRIASGWDIKGNPVELNVGNDKSQTVTETYDKFTYDDPDRPGIGFKPGDVLRYTNENITGDAEWKLSKLGVYETKGNTPVTNAEEYSIKASNPSVLMYKYDADDARPVVGNSIKTIYVTFDDNGDVDFIEVKDGLQNISLRELQCDITAYPHHKDRAEATVSLTKGAVANDSEVTAVVIKKPSNDASLKNLGYVYDTKTTNEKDEDNNIISNYKVFTVENDENWMKSASNGISNRRFVRFNELENDLYRMRVYDRVLAGTSTVTATISNIASTKGDYYYQVDPTSYKHVSSVGNRLNADPNHDDAIPNIHTKGAGGVIDGVDLTIGDKFGDLISVKGAKFLDLVRKPAKEVNSAKDLKELVKDNKVTVDICFNDNPDSDEFRTVYMLVVTKVEPKTAGDTTLTSGDIALASGKMDADVKVPSGKGPKQFGVISGDKLSIDQSTGDVYASFKLDIPEWAAPTTGDSSSSVTINYQMYVNGKPWGIGDDITNDGTDKMKSDGKATGSIETYTITKQQVLSPAALRDEILNADSIYMEITSIVYDQVRIQYMTSDGAKLVIDSTGGATKDYLTTTAPGANNNLFDTTSSNKLFDTNAYSVGTLKYSVTGAKIGGTTAVDKDDFYNTGWVSNCPAFVADGDDYATVYIYGLTAPTKYSVTTPEYATGKSLLVAAASTNSAIKLGDWFKAPANTATSTQDQKDLNSTVDITVAKLLTATGADSFTVGLDTKQWYDKLTLGNPYKVTLTVTGASDAMYAKVTLVVKNGPDSDTIATGLIDLDNTNDTTLEYIVTECKGDLVLDIIVETLPAPEVSDVDWDGEGLSGWVTLTMNTPILNWEEASASWFTGVHANIDPTRVQGINSTTIKLYVTFIDAPQNSFGAKIKFNAGAAKIGEGASVPNTAGAQFTTTASAVDDYKKGTT